MPEFQMPFGDSAEITRFTQLDTFTQAYVEAMFFTDLTEDGCDDDEDSAMLLRSDATFGDLAPETLAAIVQDCAAFQERGDELVELAAANAENPTGLDSEHAGRDFWFTRQGHGVGFWDGDWPEPYATQLKELAKSFPTCEPYSGDDGRVYL